MILPKNNYYISVCCDCDWYEHCNMAPFKAQRVARTHAIRSNEHTTVVVDMTHLDTVAAYQFPQLTAPIDPPF